VSKEIDKPLTGENLPAIPDEKYPALIKGEFSPVAIQQGMKAVQPFHEKAIAIRNPGALTIHQASPGELTPYDPPGAVIVRTDALPLARREATYLPGKTGSGRLLSPENTYRQDAQPVDTIGEAQGLVRTNNRDAELSRAESIVFNAIRSQADSDGKNARVAYDSLAAMIGYSRRHVIRVVKSLISERGLLWVNKRSLKPGHNAINIYHLVNRDVTVSDKGTGIKTGKSVQPETPRVTEHVTQIAKPQAFPSLPHAPFSSESVTEKPDYTYLSAGSKPPVSHPRGNAYQRENSRFSCQSFKNDVT
jgi:hypothetical protein